MDRKLVWDLFDMFIRPLVPANEANNKLMAEWSARFHADEAGVPPAPSDVEHVDHEPDEEPDDDPHEHESPVRSRAKRRR